MSLSWGNHAAAAKAGGRVRSDPTVKSKSTKFDDVKSRINSGSTVQKLKAKSARAIALQRGEEFFRIAPGELFDLLEEYEHADQDEDIRTNVGHFSDFNPKVVVHEAEARPTVERPYLIIDVRDEAEYRDNHLCQAKCFPQRLLMQDRNTAELVKFKNSEGRLIVLYDDAPQQRLACAAAQILATRGFDNIYVLSGGLTAFATRHATFVEGSWHSRENAEPRQASRTQGKGSSGGGASSRVDGARLGTSSGRSQADNGLQHGTHHGSQAVRDQMRDRCTSSVASNHASSHLLAQRQQQGQLTSRSSSGGGSGRMEMSGLSGGMGGLKSLRGRPESFFEEDDERASRASAASVADSVMSRAQNRKQAVNGSSRAHYR